VKGTVPILAVAFAGLIVAGCDDDPMSSAGDPRFEGQWVLVSTVVAKTSCPAQPGDFLVEEVRITQQGQVVELEFADYVVSGTVDGGVLVADRSLPQSGSFHLELSRAGDVLEGVAEVQDESCQQQRSVVARPRTDDRDFSGFWGFTLTVVGEDGCDAIVDYDDCFGILQDGVDLLVVDDEVGNLNGMVLGDVARIDRDTETEITSLLFAIDPAGDRLTGTAIRTFPAVPCRTVLDFVGIRREQPCAGETP
jgi:hypothetical protein